MTTGSFNNDLRLPVQVISGGDPTTVQIGITHIRSWNGNDYPPVRPSRPFSLYSEPDLYVPLTGSPQRPPRTAEEKTAMRHYYLGYGPRPRPPKRARTEEHPYTMSETRTSHALVTKTSTENDGYGVRRFAHTGEAAMNAIQLTWDANDDIAILGKLREKIAGSDFNAGIFLGEGRESLRMITNASTRIFQGMKAARRLDYRGVGRALFSNSANTRYNKYRDDGWLNDDRFLYWERKRLARKKSQYLRDENLGNRSFDADRDVSSLWLEFSYGWKPLVQDAFGAAQFLGTRLEAPLTQVVRVKLTKKDRNIPTNAPTSSALNGAERVATKWIKATLSEVDPYKLSGLTDPLSVAWELVPFSFVADWFIPVGNYLSGRGLISSLSGRAVVSLKKKCSHNGYRTLDANRVISIQGECWSEQVTFTRDILNDIQSLMPRAPTMKPLSSVPSWLRAANAVSLLDQLSVGNTRPNRRFRL